MGGGGVIDTAEKTGDGGEGRVMAESWGQMEAGDSEESVKGKGESHSRDLEVQGRESQPKTLYN